MSGQRRRRQAAAAPRTLSQPIQMHPTLVDIGLNLAHDSFDRDRDYYIPADEVARTEQARTVQLEQVHV